MRRAERKEVGWVGGGLVLGLGSVRVVRRVRGRERAEGPGGGRIIVVMLEEGEGGIGEVKDGWGASCRAF